MGEFIKSSGIYTLGTLSERAIQIILVPIIARTLGVAGLGIVETITVGALFLQIFLTSGMDAATARFYVAATSDDEKRKFASTALIHVTTLTAITLIVLIPFSSLWSELLFGNDEYTEPIALALFAYSSLTFATYVRNILRIDFRAKTYALLSVGVLLTQLTMVLIFVVWLELGPSGIFISIMIAHLVIAAIAFVAVRRSLVPLTWSAAAWKDLIRFGLPIMPFALAAYALVSADRFFINVHEGVEAVGIYAVAAKIGGIVSIGMAGVRQAWGPYVYATFNAPDAPARFGRIFLLTAAIVTAMVVGLSLLGRELVLLFAGDEFLEASELVLPLSIAAATVAIGFVYSVGFGITRRTGLMSILGIVSAGVAISLNAVLVPQYGLAGAAIGTAVGGTVYAALLSTISNRQYRIDYDMLGTLVLVGTGAIALVAWYQFLTPATPSNLIFRFLLSAVAISAIGLVAYSRGLRGMTRP
jgi:O-antigen/teichoic acid export membrane protein